METNIRVLVICVWCSILRVEFSIQLCWLPEPMLFGDWRDAAYSIVLISYPNNQNYVERCGCVVEKLGHYGFHTWKYNSI